MWEIKGTASIGPYNFAIVKNHPKATKHGYVLEHRVVMENHLGRMLDDNEIVHHINENGKDNRIENLEIMSREEHTRMHTIQRGKKCVTLCCPNCKVIFDREYRKTFLVKGGNASFCSHSCSGKFYGSNKTQKEINNAFSNNVIRVYKKYPCGTTETLDTGP